MTDEDVDPGDDDAPPGGEKTLPMPAVPPGAPTAPLTIAGYRILRRIGAGGMGIVYEAEQQKPRRTVALKVIRGGPFVDEHQVRLFEREAQALARLKHPGIAAIYEAGSTAEGQHFFAMELVQGVPLDEYLRSRPTEGTEVRAGLRSRLALFLQICAAINYAHQRRVIHRDLKPSNVLVITGDDATVASSLESPSAPLWRIKVLDFGLARLTDSDIAATTVAAGYGQIAGTLAYMSPEQARGNPDEIDLRSDVYSLGVILYQMLTGVLPCDVSRSSLPEAVRVICEEPPRRPSAVQPQVRGDLETITLKALEKEPAQRYQSALALAEDTERYLTDQPILARPPSTSYQLRKLIARHRTAFGFAVGLVVLLGAFAITMAVMFGLQRRERLRADAARAKAEQTTRFLQEMLASVDPEQARGREVTVRAVLDVAARDVEKGLADQPEVQTAIRSTIGKTYLALGLYDAAEVQARAALETRRRLSGERNPEYATSLFDLANVLYYRGDIASSESLFVHVVDLRRELLGGENSDYAVALETLASVRQDQGRLAEAESLYQATYALNRRIHGPEHPAVAISLNSLASLYEVQGRYAEAESLNRQALDLRRRSFGDDHPSVCESYANLGGSLECRGKYAEAIACQRTALDLARKLYGGEHSEVATNAHNLALTLADVGAYAEAESLLREALQVWRKTRDPSDPLLATGLSDLGAFLMSQRRFAEAEPWLQEALDIRRKALGETHPNVGISLQQLSRLYRARGQLNQAYPLLEKALALYRSGLGEDHPFVTDALLDVSIIRLQQGRFAAAESLSRSCLERRERRLGPEDPQVSDALVSVARACLALHQPAEAESLLRRALSICPVAIPGDQGRRPLAQSLLGACLTSLGRYPQAESLLVGSLPYFQVSPEVSTNEKRRVLEAVVALYEAWGKPSRAEPYRATLRGLAR